MSKTLELRKLITSQLKSKCQNVYFGNAQDDAQFPYIVFNFSTTVKNYKRDDISLIIDIWDKNQDTSTVENLADDIERLLDNANLPLPSTSNYPTIYFQLKNNIDDDDKSIQRRQLRFTIQNYNLE